MHRSANYLAGVGYALIFGFSFLVIKEALVALDPIELLAMRFVLAALIMSVLVAARVVKVDYRGKKLRDLLVACAFQPIAYFVCETFGVKESASSTAGIVLGALPAAVAVMGAIMLDEKLTRRQAACLTLSILGVATIVIWGGAIDGRAGTMKGFLFLLGAVASATFFNIYSRKSTRSFSPVEITFAMMWTGALCFGGITLVRAFAAGGARGPLELLLRAAPAWPGVLYLGALSSVVAFFFVNFTLSRLKASQSVVFANLVTVVAIVAGVVIRGEAFGLLQLAGSLMIVLGVWGTNAPARKRAAANAATGTA
jgi:drug/metabolite transporter (DMT)-like permease